MSKTQEALKLALEFIEANTYGGDDVVQLMTAIREALAEQPAQQQEPVAFVNADHLQGLTLGNYGYVEIYTDESAGRIPLYTSPPASKPWVGLSYEEVKELIEFEDYENDPQGFIEFVEAKLREKNA